MPCFLTKPGDIHMGCITLIGMPGCGKSTIGVLLAKTAGKDFLDTDLLLQEREKQLLQEIIDRRGNDYFQQAEEELLCGLQRENTVIATGGSAVYYPSAMIRLGELGAIAYIRLSLATIEKRLNNIRTRGITMAPGERIADIYQKRTPLYEKYANIVVDGEGKDAEQIMEEIFVRCEKWSK